MLTNLLSTLSSVVNLLRTIQNHSKNPQYGLLTLHVIRSLMISLTICGYTAFDSFDLSLYKLYKLGPSGRPNF